MTQSTVNDENGENSEVSNNESIPQHPTANIAAQHCNTGSETPLERLTALLPGSNEASESNVAYEMERKLVAWVLLLRMEHDDLCLAWTKHGSDLEEFATKVLLQDIQEYEDNNKESDMILLYLQLVCQVTSRLPVNLYSKPLGERILEVWLLRMEPIRQAPEPWDVSPEWLSMVWTNVCSTADIYFQADPDAISNWVGHLFRCFRDFHHSRSTDDARPKEATPPNELSLIEEEELLLMKETLRRILNRTNNLHVSDFHETMLLLLSQDAVLSRIPPDMAIDLLDFVIVPSTRPKINRPMTIQQTWNQCCLQWILNRITTSSSSQSSKTARSFEIVKQVLLQRPAFLPHFHKWLLSHVISPDTASMTCRSMTWQVLVSLTHWYGWGWIMTQTIGGMDVPMERTSNNNFGPAKLFCTWMRLASGELRIQLQSILGCQESYNGENPDRLSSPCRQVEHPTGEACARLLQGGVAYTIQMVDQQPHVASSLSVDALLHLRQSLEESLWTSVEYLTLNGAAPCSSPLYSAMLSLFGTLLMEVDIFDLIHPNHARITNLDDENGGSSSSTDDIVPSPQVILTCLDHVLPMVQDPILLPGLVHILSNVQDDGQGRTDPIKLELIQTLLKKSLLKYLECFWRTQSEQNVGKEDSRRPLEDGQILEWALSCTELFSELLDSSISLEGLCQL